MNKKFIFILFYFFLLQSSFGQDSCQIKTVSAQFFNGVGNTSSDAVKSGLRVSAISGLETYVAYNTTGSEVGATKLQDIAETFVMLSKELDRSGWLADQIYLIFDIRRQETDGAIIGFLKNLIPAVADFFDGRFLDAKANFIAAIGKAMSTPPTEADLANHRGQIDSLVKDGKLILMIGHSQGNLFMNQAYAYAKTKTGSSGVVAIHIAPASPNVNGRYMLSDHDLIINGLRHLSPVQPNNITLPAANVDKSGHMLVETYLDDTRVGKSASVAGGTARQMFKSLVAAAKASLVPYARSKDPACEPPAPALVEDPAPVKPPAVVTPPAPVEPTPPVEPVVVPVRVKPVAPLAPVVVDTTPTRSIRYRLKAAVGNSTTNNRGCGERKTEERWAWQYEAGDKVTSLLTNMCFDAMRFEIEEIATSTNGFNSADAVEIDQANTSCSFSAAQPNLFDTGFNTGYRRGFATYSQMFPARLYGPNHKKAWEFQTVRYVSGDMPYGLTLTEVQGSCKVAWTEKWTGRRFFITADLATTNVLWAMDFTAFDYEIAYIETSTLSGLTP